MQIQHFFDPDTSSLTYVVYDEASRDAVVIDPVLDYDAVACQTSTRSVEQVAAFLLDKGLRLHLVLETHAHADHLSAAQYLRRRFSAKLCIGARITEVQKAFAGLFGLGDGFPTDGSQFDLLLHDGVPVTAGTLSLLPMSTPGHTPACLSYRIEDAIFVGDAIFIEDYGTGRCDFPGGDAEVLYKTIHERLYALPGETRVFVGHDYMPGGRPLRFFTTIAAEKERNVHLKAETSRDAFVAFRRARDATLSLPRLLYPSVQVNINAGKLPSPEPCGRRYLRLPLNLRAPTSDDGVRLEELPDASAGPAR
jgi:glyoxylase-like metal-dependent hydrolase (beta-lactamase superfamily II)